MEYRPKIDPFAVIFSIALMDALYCDHIITADNEKDMEERKNGV